MRTCDKCGCYLPDKWDTCPACFTKEGQTQYEIKKVTYEQPDRHEGFTFIPFRVDVLYCDERPKVSNVFASYETAKRYAINSATRKEVYATLLIDYCSGRIIKSYTKINST